MQPVYTTPALAELLDCEETTIKDRAAAGDLPGLKIGRSWIFPAEALHQALNELARRDAAARRAPAPRAAVATTSRAAPKRRAPPPLPSLS
ncbi:MAG: helix-turn-helix domain-containing protein [Aquincola sp.]|nr:helix-turn-helix domain-containing protein [Aquincola sp.]